MNTSHTKFDLAAIEAEAASLNLQWAPLPLVSFKDYSQRKHDIAKQLLHACQTAGFFYVIDHGVDTEEIEALYTLAERAHREMSLEEHLKYKTTAAVDGVYTGYVGSDSAETVTGYYNLAKPGSGFEKPYPPLLEQHIERLDRFQAITLDVNDKILKGLALGMGLEEDYFVRIHGRRTKSGSHLRLMWYPARDESKDGETNNVRVQGHSDFGSITMMYSPQIVALQALDSTSTTWRYIKPIPNALVCNIGDTLQFITGSVLKSTQHRVTRPPLPSQQTVDRYNLLYFLRADDETLLRPAPSPLVPSSAKEAEGMGLTAGDWVKLRVTAAVQRREYDGTKEDREKREEYNRLQGIVNRGQGRAGLEESFAVEVGRGKL